MHQKMEKSLLGAVDQHTVLSIMQQRCGSIDSAVAHATGLLTIMRPRCRSNDGAVDQSTVLPIN
jgi:hypothetical protein